MRLRRRSLVVLLAGVALGGGALITASAPPPSLRSLTAAQWREDVDYFLRELPKRHLDAFHHASREELAGAGADLRQRVAAGNADEILVGMMQVTAAVGDLHTSVRLPSEIHRLPVAFAFFGDELRVVRATEEARALLGGRLLRVEEVAAADVVARLRTVLPQAESEYLVRGLLPSMLGIAEVLHGLGVVADPARVRLTVGDDTGAERSLLVVAVPGPGRPSWVAAGVEPLYRQRPDETFWVTWLPEAGTVYVAFRGYDDLARHARELWALLDTHPARKLVIDLRQNGGGDYTEGRRHLVSALARRGKPRLYALIGNRTFSAAMNNAIDLRRDARAVLVGEPIGELPNSYQENDEMTLPRSRLVVSYSTRFYEFLPAAEGASPVVLPDHTIAPTWEDFRDGRDPVLDWVLAQP